MPASRPHELGLVIVGNAMAGRLSDQGCVRGQTWLRKAGLSEAAIVNVDNSCAGGSSALHLATMAATAQDRPVLALGVEKMWTGDRAETIAGIEDGLPAEYRHDLHDRRHADDNPAGSILMGLNNGWAHRLHGGGRAPPCARSPPPPSRRSTTRPATRWPSSSARVTIDEVLASPQVAGVLTRLMCSSFTDGAAAVVLGGPSVAAPASAPRIIGSVARSGKRLARLPRPADPDRRRRPGRPSASGPARPTWSSCTTPPPPRSSTPWSRSASSPPVRPGPATEAGRHRHRLPRARGQPQRRPRRSWPPARCDRPGPGGRAGHQFRGRAVTVRSRGARIGVAVNTGGIIYGDAGFVGIHAVRSGSAA